MATYKQKIPRVQHVERDSEESEQEWVVYNAPNKPIERRLVNNVSDDEDWQVLSDTSLVEEGIPTFENNSEIASGGSSDYDSEQYFAQDETRSIESFIRKMPSHDGTGNFFNATPSDGPIRESSTSLASSYSDQDNESSSRDLERSIISDETSQDTRRVDSPVPTGKNSQKSWITKFRDVFRVEEDEATQQIYHKLAESASSAANFELGGLGNTNPIKVLANVCNENANSATYTTVTTQYVDSNQSSQADRLENLPAPTVHLSDSSSSMSSVSSSANVVDGPRTERRASIITRFNSRLIPPRDPMTINFAPTISNDMLNEMITENVNSADHQRQQSQTSSQSDKNSLLSTVWTTFCRITNNINNIIISNDIDSVPNDFSHPTSLTFTSSNHNTGLASIITGDNHYDTCYPPFGNHLTLSELWPSYKSHSYYSSSSTPSTSSHNKSITTSSNTARIFLTPVSSSTSLKSFTSRAGSDCGLESGRGIGRSTILEAPLVL